MYHERGRGRQLALAKEKSLDLFADAWVNISRSNQSGLKITFSAEFEFLMALIIWSKTGVSQ